MSTPEYYIILSTHFILAVAILCLITKLNYTKDELDDTKCKLDFTLKRLKNKGEEIDENVDDKPYSDV